MIATGPTHLLMIEPAGAAESAVDDEFTAMAESLWERSVASNVSYRGWHTCACGAKSDNREWFTPEGRQTNSLLVHYVRHHRSEIPPHELRKLADEAKNL